MDKQGRLREMVDIRESLNEKLKVATEAQLSAEELAARMDEMMEAEERRQKVERLCSLLHHSLAYCYCLHIPVVV